MRNESKIAGKRGGRDLCHMCGTYMSTSRDSIPYLNKCCFVKGVAECYRVLQGVAGCCSVHRTAS